MSESTDEVLSHACDYCGKRFHRSRHVNRFTSVASVELLGKPVQAKYCSPNCRKNAWRKRKEDGREAARIDATPLADPFPQVEASHASTPTRQADAVAFEDIRAGRQFSRWEPCASPDPNNPGFEIPEFLRRT
jgi:ssDNA-binding Zn-finger/Zn-ribbon topoisomerase 1